MMLTLISMTLTMTYLADNLRTGACLVILVRQGAPEPVSHSQHRHWRIWETNLHLAKHETGEKNNKQVKLPTLHSEAYGQLEWGFRVDMALVFRLVGSSNSLQSFWMELDC